MMVIILSPSGFRWVVYDIALSITQAIISLMDQKSWPAPAADATNP